MWECMYVDINEDLVFVIQGFIATRNEEEGKWHQFVVNKGNTTGYLWHLILFLCLALSTCFSLFYLLVYMVLNVLEDYITWTFFFVCGMYHIKIFISLYTFLLYISVVCVFSHICMYR